MFACCVGNRRAGMQSGNCSLAVPLRMSVTSGQGQCLKLKELETESPSKPIRDRPGTPAISSNVISISSTAGAQLVFRSTFPGPALLPSLAFLWLSRSTAQNVEISSVSSPPLPQLPTEHIHLSKPCFYQPVPCAWPAEAATWPG